MEILVFLIGASLGSFLGVVVARLGREGGIVAGRSHCPLCRHTLAWYELVPLVSFFILRGRCRHCHGSIHWRYPLYEAISGLVAVGWYTAYGDAGALVAVGYAGILLGLVALAFYDAEHFLLPDRIMLALVGVGVVVSATGGRAWYETVLAAFLASIFFAILFAVSKGRWIGLGDVKFAALIGILFPYRIALTVLVGAAWGGAIVGIVLLSMGRATGKTPLPFGVFLAAAAILAILFPDGIRLFTGFIPRIF